MQKASNNSRRSKVNLSKGRQSKLTEKKGGGAGKGRNWKVKNDTRVEKYKIKQEITKPKTQTMTNMMWGSVSFAESCLSEVYLLYFEYISETVLSDVYLNKEVEPILLLLQELSFYTSICSSTGIKNVCTFATSVAVWSLYL